MKLEIKIERAQKVKAKPSGELGFGRYFTDHMFIADYHDSHGWQNPRITPYQPFQMDPGASVLHYGQALFEGMKAFRGDDGKIRLFRPEMNYERMKKGAERLCMAMPEKETFLEGLVHIVNADIDWIPSKPGTALYLRPTLIGTEAFLGVRPSLAFSFFIIASPVGGYYGETIAPVKIWVERKYCRAAPGGIGAVKAAGNYASSLLAATEAKKRGYAQVMWLDACHKKYIEEVGTMNVFFKIGDTVITPPLSGTILPGVMRNSVIELLKKKNIKLEERPLTIDEVIQAHDRGDLKEIFGSGTAASISPVGALGLDERILTINDGQVGAVSEELYKTITDIQYGRIKDEMSWIVEVPKGR